MSFLAWIRGIAIAGLVLGVTAAALAGIKAATA
jgi:hypothetical protein